MTTLFVKRLTVIDFSFLHPVLGLLGESWQVDIELDGSLDHQGMVLDFGEVKRQVKQVIDQSFDHRLLVPLRHAGCNVEQREHRCEINFRLESEETIHYSGPDCAVAPIDAMEVDEASLAEAITRSLKPLLPDNVDRLRIRLGPERIDGPWYRYSHGLKHHAGNCQRIAHGHRSRIHIYRNEQRDRELEADWANRWRDIYIGTMDDLLGSIEERGHSYFRFGYTAQQGLFQLQLPSSRCYLIERDTTVENLAQHIAEALKQEHPEESFRVEAFEGVDKGAIGYSP
ncbi:MAG: 6-carboxytetrahydropterin synthase [Sedimenticola sp.]|nr:6-carboxytetrahydropterin synthase [Sedimenticola sp.]